MKIRIFVLGVDSSGADSLLDGVLMKTFAEQIGENGIIEYFKTVKEATAAIQTAFADSRAVFFLAQEENYGNIKNIISRAFGIRLKRNDDIIKRASAYAPEQVRKNVDFEEIHGFLPENGKLFISPDGLYSGFASVRGIQSIVFMPYSADRAANMLSTQVIPFINSLYGQTVSTAFAEHLYAAKLYDVMKDENVGIALALTKTADLFREYISSYQLLAENITKTPRSEERGNMRPSEYVVNLSIAAAELQGAPYGIVISNAYYLDEKSKDRLTVFMAVTNASSTTVREVKSFAWEATSDFMRRCCGELCKLLCEIIEADRLDEGRDTPENSKKVQRYRVLIAITGALIILLGIVGWYIFSSNSYSVSDWAQEHLPGIFGQQVISDDNGELDAADMSTDALLTDAVSETESTVNITEVESTEESTDESTSDETDAEDTESQEEEENSQSDTQENSDTSVNSVG